jgi:hypothetical protein
VASKPTRSSVPYPAAALPTSTLRAVGQKLTAAWATGRVRTSPARDRAQSAPIFVAKSPPDGYTLLLADIGSLAISPSVFASLPFDPVKDFAPVIMVAYSPHLLVVHPSVTAKDAKELIAQAKAKPNSLNFAVSGSAARTTSPASTSRSAPESSGPTFRTRAARRRSPTWSAASRR